MNHASFSFKKIRRGFLRLLLVVFVMLLPGISRWNVVKATNTSANPPCYGVTGQGQPWKLSGVPPVLDPGGGTANSGVVYFQDYPIGSGNPQLQYQTCVADLGNGTLRVEGWAWNDNLGWISFYCPAGAPGVAKNTGLDCSNAGYTQGYGVTINKATGVFSGYAWSDNAGWIGFGCSGGMNGTTSCGPATYGLKFDVNHPLCAGKIYSVKPDPSCDAHSKSNTVAWSDSVGWIDFDGISIPWNLLTLQVNVHLTLEKTGAPGADASGLTLSTAPIANGSDSYTLRLIVQDQNGNALPAQYTLNAVPEWTTDTVKLHQTDTSFVLDNKNCVDLVNGAVTKPCTALASSGPGIYSSTITSKAPTSNMNGWASDSQNALVDTFSYDDFVLPSAKILTPSLHNDLVFKDVLLSVVDPDSGICVYGNPAASGCASGLPVTLSNSAQNELKFRPQTTVTLKDPQNNIDFIEMSGANAIGHFPVVIGGPNPGTVTFYSGIDANPLGFNLLFAQGGILDFSSPSFFSANSSTSILDAGIALDPAASPLILPSQYIPGLYMYSEVTDTSTGATYFSDKLPKKVGSVAVLPVAIIQGNVYSNGAVSTTNNSLQAVQSIGDVSTNILRDTLFKNVSNIIAGIPQQNKDTIILTTDGKKFQKDPNSPAGNLFPLLPDSNGSYKVYYHYGDLILDEQSPASNISWLGDRTIVVIGGNVYIKANVYDDPQTYSTYQKAKLGIIVLKDYKSALDKQAFQGHIYIDPAVTHIQANIFADGTIFSAPLSADPFNPVKLNSNNNGEPDYADVADHENQLKYNQLMIEGSIASQNTLGGSSNLDQVTQQWDPIIGSGQSATGPDKLLQARLYDLNYLRYYKGVLLRDSTPHSIYCGDPKSLQTLSDSQLQLTHPAPDNTPWTAYETPAGCLYSPVDQANGVPNADQYHSAFTVINDQLQKLGATYIIFDPPPATLPGFNSNIAGSQRRLPQ